MYEFSDTLTITFLTTTFLTNTFLRITPSEKYNPTNNILPGWYLLGLNTLVILPFDRAQLTGLR